MISEDITSRKLAEHRLRQTIEETNLVWREIHYPVKNNLQVVHVLVQPLGDDVEVSAGPGTHFRITF